MTVRANGHKGSVPVRVGHEARELIGRTPVGLTHTVRPIRPWASSPISSPPGAFIVAILRMANATIRGSGSASTPRSGCPPGATALERRGLIEAVEAAGVSRVDLIPGAGGPAPSAAASTRSCPRAHMVVDVGGGTAKVSAFCFGGILASRSCRVAGDEMTLALLQYLRQEHQLMVGELPPRTSRSASATPPPKASHW